MSEVQYDDQNLFSEIEIQTEEGEALTLVSDHDTLRRDKHDDVNVRTDVVKPECDASVVSPNTVKYEVKEDELDRQEEGGVQFVVTPTGTKG